MAQPSNFYIPNDLNELSDQRGDWSNKEEISSLYSVAFYYTCKATCRMVNIAHFGTYDLAARQ